MTPSTIEKAVTFFYPFLKEEAFIIFYGGEPLLAFDKIKYAVSLIQEKEREGMKKLRFTLTTNGSLVTDETLHFFDLHRFKIMLSFDGQAQDNNRKSGSREPTRELMQRLQGDSYPGIDFSTNSVITPDTVTHLTASVQDIIESGVTDLQFSLAKDQPWDEAALLSLEKELKRLVDFLVSFYKDTGVIPVAEFKKAPPRQKSRKTFKCDGGRSRMAITAEENLLGCLAMHSYLKDQEESHDFHTYSFGKLDDFIKNYETVYPRVLANYVNLRQDCFFTENRFCFLCEEVENCGVCPAYVAYATSFIGKIPTWICRIIRIERNAKRKFLEEIDA